VKVFKNKRYRRLAIAGLVAFVVGLLSIYLLVSTYLPFIYNAEKLRAILQEFGIIAPAVYTVAHIIQVVFMAIPGYAMAVVGGYLFGTVWGTAYTMIGVIVGSTVAFLIARIWGRPLVERMLTEDVLERFDTFTDSAGIPGLFLFVLVPVLPEDVISFVAGLAQFRLSVFVAVMFLGRLPAATVAVMAGDGFAGGHYIEGGIWISTLVLACGYTYYYRDPIMDRIERL